MRANVLLPVLAITALLAATGYVFAPADVTARVVDTQGRPVAGAVVTAPGPFARSATTGPGGAFTLARSPRLPNAGVDVSAPGYLPAGGGIGQTVVLHRRPLLLGRLVDDAGQGVDHAVVSVEVSDRVWQTVTDGSGFYRLENVLEPGRAQVVAVADAHDALRAQVDLAADHAFQLDGAMARQLGTLVLATDPAGAVPTLDGAPIDGCPATPCSPAVTAGRHTLAFGGDLYVPWSTTVTVWEGESLPVTTALSRKTGTLAVTAPPGANATLSIDGQAVGTLNWSGVLATGPHTVTYSAGDHWPAAVTANVAWNQTTTVSVSSAAVTAGDEAGFQAGMAQYLRSLPGQFSAWVTPLAGGDELGYQPTSSMEAASVIKLPLAIYLESQDQAGKLKMSDQVELEAGDFMGGTGTLYGSANPGDKYAYHDLLALLIQESDNTAWQALDRVLGNDKVDAFAAGIGGPDCHQLDDQCTAREAGLMLQQLAAGRLLDAAHTQDLVGLLENTVFNDRINFYLGQYAIAHKVGMDGDVMNDTGVVYGSRPFVVSVFTDADPSVGVEAIRQVARLAARLYGD